jgi:hypothetical protein
MTAAILDTSAFSAQFDDFDRVFRWMPRREYWVDRERPAFDARLLPPDVDWWRDYMATMTRWTAPPPDGDGKVVQRVIVDDGPGNCAYQAWLAAADKFLQQAGEDLRRMPRDVAASLGLPEYDFFVFVRGPDVRLVIPFYDAAGRRTQAVLVSHADSPDMVDQHCAWRDLVLRYAPAVAVPAA